MANAVVFGAGGKAGTRIVAEAARRGHHDVHTVVESFSQLLARIVGEDVELPIEREVD